jgi:type II secretion system protein G
MKYNRIGFTLIELLIVVAIIAILAAIAIPNFLAAQTRSKVARTQADMRSVATAVESYYVDNNDYPWVVQNPGYNLPKNFTTPISYMSSLPKDPFGFDASDDIYFAYGNTPDYWWATKAYYDAHGWIWSVWPGGVNGNPAKWDLLSKGPDHAWARNPPQGPGVLEVDQPYSFQYDPSNGTVSEGNIIRSGP